MLDRTYLQSHIVTDKFVLVSNTNYAMKPEDQIMRVIANTSSVTLTLPKVAEARGRFYSIFVRTPPNGHSITVTAEGAEAWSNVDIGLAGAYLFYSDGLAWILVTKPEEEEEGPPE